MERTYMLQNRRRVIDVMSSPAITVRPETLFAAIATCFEKHHISAVPVVDEWGLALGIVSEADLLIKTERQEPAKQRWFATREQFLEDAKAAGLTAADLMTSPAITVSPHASLARAARLMHERHVKRLPVVDEGGRVIGVVSRADLVKIFTRSDAEIRQDIVEQVIHRALFLDPETIDVTVTEGEVWLAGEVDRRSEIAMIAGFTAAVDGVVSVHSEDLSYRVDDREIHNVEVESWRHR